MSPEHSVPSTIGCVILTTLTPNPDFPAELYKFSSSALKERMRAHRVSLRLDDTPSPEASTSSPEAKRPRRETFFIPATKFSHPRIEPVIEFKQIRKRSKKDAKTNAKANKRAVERFDRLRGTASPIRSSHPEEITMVDSDFTIIPFFTRVYVFSNHYPCRFVINGITFTCSEQYYMYSKAVHFNDDEMAKKILTTNDPKKMKDYGRQVAGFDTQKWREVAVEFMARGCYEKFTQNPDLKKALLSTGNAILVEASPMDRFWGVGMMMDHPCINDFDAWQGENYLGYLLTNLRNHLREVDRRQLERMEKRELKKEKKLRRRDSKKHRKDEDGAKKKESSSVKRSKSSHRDSKSHKSSSFNAEKIPKFEKVASLS